MRWRFSAARFLSMPVACRHVLIDNAFCDARRSRYYYATRPYAIQGRTERYSRLAPLLFAERRRHAVCCFSPAAIRHPHQNA